MNFFTKDSNLKKNNFWGRGGGRLRVEGGGGLV